MGSDVADGFAYMTAYANLAKQALEKPHAPKTMGIPTVHIAAAGDAYDALKAKLDKVRELAFGCVADDEATNEAEALDQIKAVLDGH